MYVNLFMYSPFLREIKSEFLVFHAVNIHIYYYYVFKLK